MPTTGMRWERVVAWVVVAIVHVASALLLLRVPAPHRQAPAAERALDVVWVPRRSSRDTPQRIASTPQRERSRRARPPQQSVAPDAAPVQREAAKPMSAVLLGQVRLPGSGEIPALAADPFAYRAVRLPGRDARTFRMRPPPSLAERVAAVGRMFGGGDDPCRSVRDSINELSQAGDSRVLRDALDYEQRHCR